MEWLHCCLCYCSLWHHNAITVSSVTSQWGTHGDAISNQKPPSSNNPHNINWIKLEIFGHVLVFALKIFSLPKFCRPPFQIRLFERKFLLFWFTFLALLIVVHFVGCAIQIKYGLPYCVTCPSMSTDPGIRTNTGAGDTVLAKHT